LSSSAYATEEMLGVLIFGGLGALVYFDPDRDHHPTDRPSRIVIFSLPPDGARAHRTVRSSGSAYIVASENLGKYPGLIAASSLLIDYVLTVRRLDHRGLSRRSRRSPPDLTPLRVLMAVSVIVRHHVAQPARREGKRERSSAGPTYALHLPDRCVCVSVVLGTDPVLHRTKDRSLRPPHVEVPAAASSTLFP